MKFVPRKYQEIAIKKIKEKPRYALFLGMGLGKTSSVLQACVELDTWPVLVIAPLRVADTTWPDEVDKWDNFSHLRVVPITGTAKQREVAVNLEAEIYTTNYENLEWLVEHYGKKWPFKTVVADELSKLKGFRLRQGTKRARALARVAFTCVDRFIGLTGTPSPNGVKDLWGQMWFLDKGDRLGRTYSIFIERWFRVGYDGYSVEALPHAADEIQTAISDLCLSIHTSEYFDVKEPIVNKIYVDLPISSRSVYKEMERNMLVELNKVDIESPNAAALTNKCLQIAQGFLYDENKVVHLIHDQKLQALDEIIEEVQSPLLVVYTFKSDLKRLKERYKQGVDITSDPKNISKWNKGKIPLMFLHPASAGHGISLQDGGHHIVFYGHNWNLEEYLQVIERIGPVRQLQSGYDRNVFIHHIIAKDTIEERVMERLETKKSVQEILLRFLSERK